MKLIGLRYFFVVIFFASSSAYPATTDDKSNGEPPKQLNVWLTQTCPSKLAEDGARVAIAGLLIAKAVDFFVDKTSEAITNAAKEDREGKSTVSTSAAYVYRLVNNSDGKPDYVLPQCVVVTISNSDPDKWCSASPFDKSLPCTTIGNSTALLSQLSSPVGVPKLEGNDGPSFWAEIELFPSADKSAAIPRLKSLYYPQAIHNVRKFSSSNKRDVSINLDTVFPSGTNAINTIHVQLRDLIPQKDFILRKGDESQKILDKTTQPTWISFGKAPEKIPSLKPGTYFGPVNIRAEIREVGDPNKFLQAFANYLNKNKDDLSEKIKDKLTGDNNNAQIVTDQIETITNEVTTADALAKVYSTESALLTSCEVPTSAIPNKNKSEIRSKWELAKSSRLTYQKLALEKGQASDNLNVLPDYDVAATVFKNCEALRKSI